MPAGGNPGMAEQFFLPLGVGRERKIALDFRFLFAYH
jgi:hypothetical protein